MTAKTQVPGTDCALPGTACLTGAALDTAREVVEGEVFQPTAPWTVTDVYDGAPFYAGRHQRLLDVRRDRRGRRQHLAAGVARPRSIDAQATAAQNARTAYNDAHRIILDDGSSTNYTTAAEHRRSRSRGSPPDHYAARRRGGDLPRAGDLRLRLQRVADPAHDARSSVRRPATQPQFAQTRAANAAPQDVGGDLKLATFNVLNYFPTTR